MQQASLMGYTQHFIKSSQSLSAPSLSLESLSRAALFAELEAKGKKCFALEQRLRELEDQTMLLFKEHLQSEVDSVVASKAVVVHVPDSPKNFSSFSIKFVIQELKDSCPELYGLIQQLSKTRRNDSDSLIN